MILKTQLLFNGAVSLHLYHLTSCYDAQHSMNDWLVFKFIYAYTFSQKRQNNEGWELPDGKPPQKSNLGKFYDGITVYKKGRATCVHLNGESDCTSTSYTYGNNLQYKLPAELNRLNNLAHIYFDSNHPEGEIPLELRELTGSKALDLSYNNLTNTIPKSIASFRKLEYYYSDENVEGGIQIFTSGIMDEDNDLDVPWYYFCNYGSASSISTLQSTA